MIEIFMFAIAIVVIIAILIYMKVRSIKDSKKFIENIYSNNLDISDLLMSKSASDSFELNLPKTYIDDITFNDLSLDKLFLKLNYTSSKVGEHELYRRLRSLDTLDSDKFENDIKSFESKNTRQTYMLPLVKLGKQAEYGYESLYGKLEMVNMGYRSILTVMRILAFAGPIMLFINLGVGITVTVFTIFTNFLLNERFASKIAAYIPLAADKVDVLKTARKISSLDGDAFLHEKNAIKDHLKQFKLNRQIFGFMVENPKTFDASGINYISYMISAYFLVIPLAYNSIANQFIKNGEDFTQIASLLGTIDLTFAIACYRNSLSTWSHPEFTNSKRLEFEGLLHPLLEKNGISNDLNLQATTLITGSNASGKSTFVRAVALNSLLAQSFNMVCATQMKLPRVAIMTSMSLVDDIESGDSYFVTETKSIKRIIDMINEDRATLVCIDEVLKGTNTVERVAASASLLNYLSQKNCIIIAATHDLELTQILKNSYANYHFSELITDEGVSFDYKVKEGVSDKTNAINLLESFGYDEALVSQARDFVREHQVSKKWPVL